jgi:hypothetical protein
MVLRWHVGDKSTGIIRYTYTPGVPFKLTEAWDSPTLVEIYPMPPDARWPSRLHVNNVPAWEFELVVSRKWTIEEFRWMGKDWRFEYRHEFPDDDPDALEPGDQDLIAADAILANLFDSTTSDETHLLWVIAMLLRRGVTQ